ncbi:MAG: hypothetical protein IIA87_03885 [Nanoarchaeota archaeon]|nr:hypothetical protein [Nanoarchaeota archaeon]
MVAEEKANVQFRGKRRGRSGYNEYVYSIANGDIRVAIWLKEGDEKGKERVYGFRQTLPEGLEFRQGRIPVEECIQDSRKVRHAIAQEAFKAILNGSSYKGQEEDYIPGPND